MAKSMECPNCGADISDSYEGAEPDVGINAGWYCDACDLAFPDDGEPEYFYDDISLFDAEGKVHLVTDNRCPKCLSTNLEMGYGLAGGGGLGPYSYCPTCQMVVNKSQDPT